MRNALAPLAVVMVAACAPPSIGAYPPAEDNDNEEKEPSATVKSPSSGDAARPADATKPILTVTIGGAGTGTIASTPGGLTCQGTACTGTFASGTAVTLIPTPGAGSMFAGWGGGCTGSGACAPVVTGPINVTAEFQTLGGTWSGTYTHSQPKGACTFNNAGNLSVTITANGAALSSKADISGLEIRNLSGCQKVDTRSGTATAPLTSAATSLTGTWDFAIPNAGTLPLPFSATVVGKTMTGKWTCATCTGSFTLTKP